MSKSAWNLINDIWWSSPLQHLLFGSLGRTLACADPPESERLTILNEAWKVITKVRSPQVSGRPKQLHRFSFQAKCSGLWRQVVFQDYVNCAEIWVEFTCRHFTVSNTQWRGWGVSFLLMIQNLTTILFVSFTETWGQHHPGWHHQTHDPGPGVRRRLPSGQQLIG